MLNKEVKQLINSCKNYNEFTTLLTILNRSQVIFIKSVISNGMSITTEYLKGKMEIKVKEVINKYYADYKLFYSIDYSSKRYFH